jgi:acetolactate synthase-1/2/3 large subunit
MTNDSKKTTGGEAIVDALVRNGVDTAFGNVKRLQQTMYDGRELAVDLKNPDFMKLADAFGVQGYRVKSPAELERAIGDAFSTPGPALIEYPLGEVPDS